MNAADDVYLAQVVQRISEGAGQSVLKQLVSSARDEKPAIATRAHALLARANAKWTTSLLTDTDGQVRMNAAYAHAERGDPSVLAMSLRQI